MERESGWARAWGAFRSVQGRGAGKGCQAPSLARSPVLWRVWVSSSRQEGLRRSKGEGKVSRKGRRGYFRILTSCPNQEEGRTVIVEMVENIKVPWEI